MALSTLSWADKIDGSAPAITGKHNAAEVNAIRDSVNQHAATLNYLLSLTPAEIVILKQLVLTMTTP